MLEGLWGGGGAFGLDCGSWESEDALLCCGSERGGQGHIVSLYETEDAAD